MDHSQHHEHDKHAVHSVAMFKNKFWICLVLTIPVLVYSEMIQHWFRFTPPMFSGAEYIPFVLGSIIFFYGGFVFIKGAFGELKNKMPGMMTLISLAIITAYGYSIATQFFIDGESFFWELATLVTIMLLGHWLEMASIAKAENALDEIAKLIPDTAEKLVDGDSQKVLVSELHVGDFILVRPGSRIPADGIIVKGNSTIDESAITGESTPVARSKDDEVVAGTTNQDGALTIKVTKLGEDTALAGIMRLVAEAQHSKSSTQVLADKAAFILTIVAVVVGVITFIAWLFIKDAGFALERMVTVLIIACPHALGLAIPLVVSIATTLSARNGLLIRKRQALENARLLDVVLFDKTGTLTKGEHEVTAIWPAEGYTEEDILHLAASLEQQSEHIIGKAIVKKANEQQVALDEATDFTALPGVGVQATLHGNESYIAAGRRYVEEQQLTIPRSLQQTMQAGDTNATTEIYIMTNNTVIGAISLADAIRPESAEAIKSLKKAGIQTAMITGDSQKVASDVAEQLGIEQYFAEVKPVDKSNKVKELQQQGKRVAIVGDGINDAPALAQADIGIAIGAGTDIAAKSADIILIKDDPRDVSKIIRLSNATYRKMVQNLIWATGYNVIAIPLAAGILYSAGVVLAPAVGAILMSVSTVVVALNAQLLRREDLR